MEKDYCEEKKAVLRLQPDQIRFLHQIPDKAPVLEFKPELVLARLDSSIVPEEENEKSLDPKSTNIQ